VSDYDKSLHRHDKKQKMESRKAASEEMRLQTTAKNRQRGCRRDVRLIIIIRRKTGKKLEKLIYIACYHRDEYQLFVKPANDLLAITSSLRVFHSFTTLLLK